MLKVRYGHARDFLADYTENISAGGVFIATEDKFERGTVLDFEISFPGLLDPIQLKGEVMWSRPSPSGDEKAGMGIKFLSEGSGPGPLSTLVAKLENPSRAVEAETGGVVFRVLLVEDNVVVRDMFHYGIRKMTRDDKLGGARIEVEEADNGKQAWDLLQQKEFNLVILDLYMPIMDGNQLIHHMRAEERLAKVPIIVVSSGGIEDRRRALKNGADIFLSKPIKLRQMVETVESLIASGHFPK